MKRGPLVVLGIALAAGVVVAVALVCGLGSMFFVAPTAPLPPSLAPVPRPVGPRNVLVIVMDTTRADRCGFLGHDRTATLSAAPDAMKSATPRLDAFAAESRVFEDAWSPASWTFPSHSSLFTGVTPDRLGFYALQMKALPNDPKVPTLAASLHDAGFATGCFTNNMFVDPTKGTTRGFGTVESVWKPETEGGPFVNSAAKAHRLALDWMNAQRAGGRRFFAFINDMEAHGPRDPAAPWAARLLRAGTTAEDEAAARAITDTDAVAPRIAASLAPGVLAAYSDLYDAEIATVDDEVGKLLDAMRAGGFLDDTLVIVLADHGEGLGEHGWLTHGCYLHRELLRVPLLVRFPARVAAGRVADLVRVEDVMPTVLELCDVAVPAGIDGRSLLAPTAGRTAFAYEHVPEDIVTRVARDFGREAVSALATKRRSVRQGDWHLIVDTRGGSLLFDVRADPGELRDLSAERPDVVTQLRALLDARSGR